MGDHDRVTLPMHLHAPALARLHLSGLGENWSPDLLDDVLLATSELVANAVHYGDGDLTLVVKIRSGTVRVEVHDDGAHRLSEVLTAPEPDDERGRGLLIVQAVADRWGVADAEQPPGKVVWFELGLQPPDAEPPPVDVGSSSETPARPRAGFKAVDGSGT